MDTAFFLWMLPLACIGLVQVFGWVAGWLLRPRGGRQCYRILSVYSGKEALEQQLRYELFKIRWRLDGAVEYILLVDMGMDKDDLDLCDTYLGSTPGFFRCTPEELPKLVVQLDNLQTARKQI